MQGYNNLTPNYGQQYGNNGMQRTNYPNYAPAPIGYTYGNQGYGSNAQYPQQQPMDERIYVTGRAGADAHQLPPGVNMQILWDNDEDRFYIKGYDNNGRPRVLADNDFQPHVEPEPVSQQNIDLSSYATKDDIAKMINQAFSNLKLPNMDSYVTQNDLNIALSNLAVGNGGRIVRNNESNA